MKNLSNVFQELLTNIGEDINREGLKNTPKRAAEAFSYLTSGYKIKVQDVVKDALFSCDNDDMVVAKDIELFSLCEHHVLPIIGKCHIGYLPNGKVLGLSKLARIVDVFARRLQIQERLTKQIANAIMEVTNAHGIGVVIEAEHLCIMARGVAKQHSVIKTVAMLGSFKKNVEIRNNFLTLIQ